MLFSNIVTLFFAAGAAAAPLVKKAASNEELIIYETEYEDGNGNVVSVEYSTFTSVLPDATPIPAPAPSPQPSPPVQAPNPAPVPAPTTSSVAPAPTVVNHGSGSSGSSSSSGSTGSTGSTGSSASLTNVAGTGVEALQNYVSAFANSAAVTTTGWVDMHQDNDTFAAISVYHTNVHRLNHSVSLVSWNNDMAQAAYNWSTFCLSDEEVPAGSGWGMNIAFSSTSEGYNPSDMITGEYYNSELENFPGYGQPNLDVTSPSFDGWGHYAQLVWPNVTEMGCAMYDGCSGAYSVRGACYYKAEGNIIGEFNLVPEPEGGQMVYPNGHTSM